MRFDRGWLAIGAAVVAAFAIAFVWMVMTTKARAQEHRHPTETITGATAKFYERWDRIDMPGVSCCSAKDCYAAAARQVGGTWFARRREDGKWMAVPAAKVETRYDSPDGLAHLCAQPPGHGDIIFCFLPAGGA